MVDYKSSGTNMRSWFVIMSLVPVRAFFMKYDVSFVWLNETGYYIELFR